ncbi:MAG: hypothetical protein QOD77_186 [Thermoplasmata archaeon]|nr:hypothetical protein [Thermoplasmata archaeon]
MVLRAWPSIALLALLAVAGLAAAQTDLAAQVEVGGDLQATADGLAVAADTPIGPIGTGVDPLDGLAPSQAPELPIEVPESRSAPPRVDPVVAVATGAAGLGLLALLGIMALKALGFTGVGLFSRIQKDDVLEHQTRQRILDAVTSRPGLHLKELQELVGVAWGTLVHHVRRLEGTGHLVSVRQGPRKLLYAANTPESRAREDLAALRNGTALRIATAVAAKPGIRHNAVCAELDLQPAAVSKHLAKLAQAGLVDAAKVDGRPSYAPTGRLVPALQLAQPGIVAAA